jgi:hypothetical protein
MYNFPTLNMKTIFTFGDVAKFVDNKIFSHFSLGIHCEKLGTKVLLH